MLHLNKPKQSDYIFMHCENIVINIIYNLLKYKVLRRKKVYLMLL